MTGTDGAPARRLVKVLDRLVPGLAPLLLGPGRPGDPGLFGPKSMLWRVARERLVLAGGPAALLLQLAHPLVAAGVADHSGFKHDPFGRLRATLDATLAISFGDKDQAVAAAARVRSAHRRVRGRLPAAVGPFPKGAPYDATDGPLAMWVHATLVEMALDTYDRLVRPLSVADRSVYFEEAKPFAELFGVTAGMMPETYEDFREYFRSMVDGPTLAVDARARDLGAAVLHPPLATVMKPAGRMVRAFTLGLLPDGLRAAYGLAWGARERAAGRAVSFTTRTVVPLLPGTVRYWPHYRVARRRTSAN
jgi:uncharacterized protein (DUF2236 family)